MTTTSSFPSSDSGSIAHSTPRIIRRLPQKRTALGITPDPTASPILAHRPPRLIPSQWTKLEPANHSSRFPDVYIAPSHSQVPAGHGNIYVIVVSTDSEDLHEIFTHGASLSSFCTLEEAAVKGSFATIPLITLYI